MENRRITTKKVELSTHGCFGVGVYNKHMLQNLLWFPEGQEKPVTPN